MPGENSVLPAQRIEQRLLLIRGQKVLLDVDLAALYGVSTKALNQAVKRNAGRFPQDFMFRLREREKAEAVTKCDHLRALKFSAQSPYAFTEQGVAMLSSVLRSPRAVQVNVEIMRAFVRLRRMIASHEGLSRRLDELEAKYDGQFKAVFEAIRQLMLPPSAKRRPVGFRRRDEEGA